MQALVYPYDSYVAQTLVPWLRNAGHQVIEWHREGASTEENEAAWTTALHQAAAVFHVLHGHENHAKDTVIQLLNSTVPSRPATFVGISTPLTWAATQPPAEPAAGASAAATAGEPTEDFTAGLLKDRDIASRRPAAAALKTYHLEQLLLRSQCPSRLATYVICPGILYGNGEDDSQLHQLFKTAWEGEKALQVVGHGLNRLPTLHVQDLAAYVEAVVLQQPTSKYLLAADYASVTQGELVAALGHLLGNKEARFCSAEEALLLPPAAPLLLLDLPIGPSTLPEPNKVLRCCPGGLLAHLPQVLQELLTARHLTPMGILVRGPPASGKTHLAKRLAHLYGLLHVDAAAILAELPFMDAETQKAATTQLSSKEGRLSSQIMARLAQHLLARQPAARNQGWVLDGWPRSLADARLFTSHGASTVSAGEGHKEGGILGKADSKTAGPLKDKKLAAVSSGSGAAAAGGHPAKDGATTARTKLAGDGRGSPEGDEEVYGSSDRQFLPDFLIQLTVPEDELLRRVKVLAVAAQAAGAAAATASRGSAAAKAGKPASASGKKDAGAVAWGAPHNNEKDWARRMEVYRQLMQEDATDLSAMVQVLLEPYTEVAAGSNPSGKPAAGKGAGSRAVTPAHGTARTGGATAATAAAGAAALEAAKSLLPPDVKLPEHGGYVAHFINAGTKYVSIENAFDEAGAAAVAAVPLPIVPAPASAAATPRGMRASVADQPIQQQQQQHLPPLNAVEQQVVAVIMQPHNYKGFPSDFILAATAAAPLVEEAPAIAAGATVAAAEGKMADATAADGTAGTGVEAADATATAVAAVSAGVEGLSMGSRRLSGVHSVQHIPQQQPQQQTSHKTPRQQQQELDQQKWQGSGPMERLDEMQAAAQELVDEQQVREQQRVERAAQPLIANMLANVMPALMDGLVQVALNRPEDAAQVVIDGLLAAATKMEAAYHDPYDDPQYARKLAKVTAKEDWEAARAAAAAPETAAMP